QAPLVLCYLEGNTCDAAARQLGWSLRTLKRRLQQGRERLHRRLARRGLALSSGLLALALTPRAEAAVPGRLATEAVRAAIAAAGGSAALAGSPAGALAEGVLGSTNSTWRKVAAACVLAGLCVLGYGAFRQPAQAQKPGESPA